MRTGYLECFSGVSGDMLLGALVDAGVSRELLERTAKSLNLGVELRFTRVDRSGISAAKVDVLVDGSLAELAGSKGHTHEHKHGHEHAHAPHDEHENHDHPPNRNGDGHSHRHGRSLPEIRALIGNAGLPIDATALALRTFELLGQSESKIHNVPVETIHFHEVGAVDAIIDVVCCAVGLTALGVDRWVCSALNVGGGFVDCAHGKFPVPAPATADLLRGAPTYSSGIAMEMVTPTGAALIRALGCSFGDAPAMRVATIGYGAGTRNPKALPNVVRLSLGDSGLSADKSDGETQGPFPVETIAVLECAVDDMNPQVLASCAQLALERGALDVMSTAVVMKKGRLGTLITMLCRQEQAEEFQELLFRETGTLGIRVRQEQRAYLDRQIVEVETQYGRVRVKVASLRGERFRAQPEYDDCRRLAAEAGVSLREVIEAATLAFAEVPAGVRA